MCKRLVLLLALGLALATGCHHDAPPATPADPPPLPPSSGTPIGYLLDDATSLNLHDDQRGRLEEIDHSLAAQLEGIDAQLRVASRPAETGAPSPPTGGGHRGGGRGGGGRHRTPAGTAPAGGGGHAADVDRLTESRAADVRDALQRAFAILDEAQRTAATKLLSDHGVDLDAGRPTPSPEPPEP